MDGQSSEAALKYQRDQCELALADRSRELQRANAALELALAQAQAANLAKSEFLAHMSHEIRTPINGIVGSVDVLKMSQLDEEQHEFLGYIQSSVRNLLAIVNGILDLSKVEAGMIELEHAPFHLRSCLDEVVGTQLATAHGKGLALQAAVDADIADLLVGDQLRLQQIILNLLSNAIKFTRRGEIAVRVARLPDAGGRILLRFSVRDTGIGLDAQQMVRVFSPYVQADAATARRYGGTGLGLSISGKFVELMQGRLWVESVLGEGSTFYAEIPFEAAEVAAADGGAADGAAGGESWEGPRLRVLVAEDNEINAKLTVRMLREVADTVLCAENGAEAVRLWELGGVDMILMDVQMPVMDGLEACRAIRGRAGETGSQVPIIALTAYALSEDREWFLTRGFDGYVAKPVTPDALLKEMKSCLTPSG